jgi:hypothetical protein
MPKRIFCPGIRGLTISARVKPMALVKDRVVSGPALIFLGRSGFDNYLWV